MYTRMETNTLAATLAVKPLPASSWACLTVRSVRPAALSSQLDRPCRLITNVGDLFRCSPFSSKYKNRFCGRRHGWTVLHVCRCKVSPLGTTNLGRCCQLYVNFTQRSATTSSCQNECKTQERLVDVLGLSHRTSQGGHILTPNGLQPFAEQDSWPHVLRSLAKDRWVASTSLSGKSSSCKPCAAERLQSEVHEPPEC